MLWRKLFVIALALVSLSAQVPDATAQKKSINEALGLTDDDPLEAGREALSSPSFGRVIKTIVIVQRGTSEARALLPQAGSAPRNQPLTEPQMKALEYLGFVQQNFATWFRLEMEDQAERAAFPSRDLVGLPVEELLDLSDQDIMRRLLTVSASRLQEVAEGADGDEEGTGGIGPEGRPADGPSVTSEQHETVFQVAVSMSGTTRGRNSAGAIVEESFSGEFAPLEIVLDLEPHRLTESGLATDGGLESLVAAVEHRLAAVEADAADPAGSAGSPRDPDALEIRRSYWQDMAELLALFSEIDAGTVVHGRPTAAVDPTEVAPFASAEISGPWKIVWSGRFLNAGTIQTVQAEAVVEPGLALTRFAAWPELHASWPNLYLSSVSRSTRDRFLALAERTDGGFSVNDEDRAVSKRLSEFAHYYARDHAPFCDVILSEAARYCLHVAIEMFDGPLVALEGAERLSSAGSEEVVAKIAMAPKLTWSPDLGLSVAYPALRLLGDRTSFDRAFSTGLLLGLPSRWGALSQAVGGQKPGVACGEQFARHASLQSATPNATVSRTDLGFSVGGLLLGADKIGGKVTFAAAAGWPCGEHSLDISWQVRPKPIEEPAPTRRGNLSRR